MQKDDREDEYLLLLRAFLEVTESIKGTPVGDSDRLLDLEGLALKVYYHGAAILYQYRGTKIPELGQTFVDPASIVVLVRTLFESALTFNYVFVQPRESAERDLRYAAWKLAGLVGRHKSKPRMTVNKQKSEEERPLIISLERDIRALLPSMGLPDQVLKEICKKGEWRLPAKTVNGRLDWPGWVDLAETAGFGRKHAEDIYRYLCGYSHSGYIPALQLRQATTPEDRRTLCDPMLNEAKISLSLTIRDYAALFEKAALVLRENSAFAEVVETWLYIGSDAISDEDIDWDAEP